jgi:hypothetical protein
MSQSTVVEVLKAIKRLENTRPEANPNLFVDMIYLSFNLSYVLVTLIITFFYECGFIGPVHFG